MKIHNGFLWLAVLALVPVTFVKLTTPIFDMTGPRTYSENSIAWFGVDIFGYCLVASAVFLILYYCTKPKNDNAARPGRGG